MGGKQINLGFTDQHFEAGVHICQIFNDENERQDALLKFLISGLLSNEKVSCFSKKVNLKKLSSLLKVNQIDLEETLKKDKLTISGTEEVYFKGNKFDPERMLNLLKSFYRQSVDENYSAARVIGEMTPKVQHVDGGNRLMEYESKVSMLLKTCPVTAVCQYNANDFDGSTIMNILKVHPYMIVKGNVVHNPFFIAPEEYLKSI